MRLNPWTYTSGSGFAKPRNLLLLKHFKKIDLVDDCNPSDEQLITVGQVESKKFLRVKSKAFETQISDATLRAAKAGKPA